MTFNYWGFIQFFNKNVFKKILYFLLAYLIFVLGMIVVIMTIALLIRTIE